MRRRRSRRPHRSIDRQGCTSPPFSLDHTGRSNIRVALTCRSHDHTGRLTGRAARACCSHRLHRSVECQGCAVAAIRYGSDRRWRCGEPSCGGTALECRAANDIFGFTVMTRRCSQSPAPAVPGAPRRPVRMPIAPGEPWRVIPVTDADAHHSISAWRQRHSSASVRSDQCDEREPMRGFPVCLWSGAAVTCDGCSPTRSVFP